MILIACDRLCRFKLALGLRSNLSLPCEVLILNTLDCFIMILCKGSRMPSIGQSDRALVDSAYSIARVLSRLYSAIAVVYNTSMLCSDSKTARVSL